MEKKTNQTLKGIPGLRSIPNLPERCDKLTIKKNVKKKTDEFFHYEILYHIVQQFLVHITMPEM